MADIYVNFPSMPEGCICGPCRCYSNGETTGGA
jgi:hypothetical protein